MDGGKRTRRDTCFTVREEMAEDAGWAKAEAWGWSAGDGAEGAVNTAGGGAAGAPPDASSAT